MHPLYPDDKSVQQAQDDENLLQRIGEIFERSHAHEKAAYSGTSWRTYTQFDMNPQYANYVFSITTRECRSALEDHGYILPNSEPQKIPGLVHYTPTDQVELEKLLRSPARPQAVREHMQDIALMRQYLGELCKKYSEDFSKPNFTPRQLTLEQTRHTISHIAQTEGSQARHLAKDMLEISDYIARKTATLVEDINAQGNGFRLSKATAVEPPTRGR